MLQFHAYDAQYVLLAQQRIATCVAEDKRLLRIFPDTVFGMRGILESKTDRC